MGGHLTPLADTGHELQVSLYRISFIHFMLISKLDKNRMLGKKPRYKMAGN